MIVSITGANLFAAKQRLDELVVKFVDKYGELALERIDAEDGSFQAILDAVQNLPFLTSKKMVVIRSLSANKPAAELIEQIISSAGESMDLIFYEPVVDKRTIYYKTLKKQTKLEEFSDLDANQLPNWLIEEAQKMDAKITFADARYLVERLGPNQVMLNTELQKLAAYNLQIDRSSIDLLTEQTPQSKVFELLDAAFTGKKKQALKLYEQQRAQKVEPQAILAMISWQLYLFSLVKFSKGRSAASIAKDANLNPYPVSKAIALSTKVDDNQLKQMVDEVFNIDWQSKTKTYDIDEALKTFIVSM